MAVAGVVLVSLAVVFDRQRSSPCSARAAMVASGSLSKTLIGARGLVRLMKAVQLDVTQQQRHNSSPA